MADEKQGKQDSGTGADSIKGKAAAALDSAKVTWKQAVAGEVLSHVEPEQTSALKGLKDSLTQAGNSEAKKEIGEKIAEATKALTEPKMKAFKDLHIGEKLTAAVGGNIGQAKGFEKGLRLGGSVVGLGVIISGTKNLIAPQRDENGERKGSAWKQVGKIAGGAALTYLSAVKGGANKAMGIS